MARTAHFRSLEFFRVDLQMFYDFICDIRAALVNYSEILFLVVPRSTAETEFVERSVDIIVPAEQVSAANRVDNAVLSTVHRDVLP